MLTDFDACLRVEARRSLGVSQELFGLTDHGAFLRPGSHRIRKVNLMRGVIVPRTALCLAASFSGGATRLFPLIVLSRDAPRLGRTRWH